MITLSGGRLYVFCVGVVLAYSVVYVLCYLSMLMVNTASPIYILVLH